MEKRQYASMILNLIALILFSTLSFILFFSNYSYEDNSSITMISVAKYFYLAFTIVLAIIVAFRLKIGYVYTGENETESIDIILLVISLVFVMLFLLIASKGFENNILVKRFSGEKIEILSQDSRINPFTVLPVSTNGFFYINDSDDGYPVITCEYKFNNTDSDKILGFMRDNPDRDEIMEKIVLEAIEKIHEDYKDKIFSFDFSPAQLLSTDKFKDKINEIKKVLSDELCLIANEILANKEINHVIFTRIEVNITGY